MSIEYVIRLRALHECSGQNLETQEFFHVNWEKATKEVQEMPRVSHLLQIIHSKENDQKTSKSKNNKRRFLSADYDKVFLTYLTICENRKFVLSMCGFITVATWTEEYQIFLKGFTIVNNPVKT